MKIIASNKKAKFNYFLLDATEVGIVLKGTEIKSIRANKVNIGDAYCIIRNEEMFIVNMHISAYDHGNVFNHNETRSRKLLLHKKQIIKMNNKVMQEDLSIIPTKVYMEKGLCKLEISLAKGKKNYDKRQSIKERDDKRNIDRRLKERY
ncbi:SsrA-binding protein [Candidatus Izimaplasma bacterium HR1]|jgi:SsrA-binding protein|uniref:SsrA-binding protein SmpB n=1 Tax=Candidatus Izimoplasma sp. HR1 TaxID=1541959 RepID=UPI0004F92830|nr:SsrA-binding protein [Candidatus Izimaplasma bacterium HR1]